MVDAVHMLGSEVGPVVELQTISWLPVGQAEVDDAVAVGHLMIVLKFFGDSDVGGTQASQKKGGRAVVVVGYEFEHLLGEVGYEVSLYGLAILQLFQLFELSHSRFYLVV